MSIVTNVLVCGLDADDHIKEINEWLKPKGHLPMVEIGEQAGGEKHIETGIVAGAFNYFSMDERPFIKFLKTIDWEYEIDLFIQRQEENRFTRIVISKGK